MAAGHYSIDIMKLTALDASEPVRTIVEAMGMMMVKVEAREVHLGMLVEELRRANEKIRQTAIAAGWKGLPAPTDGREDSAGGADRAVADGYDAMTTDRPYRKRMSSHVALGILQEHAGRKWDAECVAALGSVLSSESFDGDLSLVMILCPTAVCDRGKAGCAAGIYGEWIPLVPRKQWPSGAARIRRESGIISSTERI